MIVITTFIKYLAAILGVAATFFYLLQGLMKGDMQKYKTGVIVFIATIGVIVIITGIEILIAG
jgi:hypothetical protein